ncbi:GMC family oxidoreductase N-terminal domain-containing protein [Flammeovirgaceae bacterium SG7u.111]|nr:GMC family oxidoreductase N-terminal domain-containing protein [Flammeovirgaceae bacterium SG7u.132]WPO35438.1 GMC family oxidoreductase N-terminal domain-containing protein [Flammeovirgaceae bacterium SG7u.111]
MTNTHENEKQNLLSHGQMAQLVAICNSIIPSLEAEEGAGYWLRKASDLDVAQYVEEAISIQSLENQKDFCQLLDVFGSPFAGLLFAGSFKPFDKLSPTKQEKWLRAWSASSILLLRKGFSTLKKLSCFIYYTVTNSSNTNPNWETIGYPGVISEPPQKARNINTITSKNNSTLHCEVLIVGSGAGGGVVAGELAKAGKDVLVVDKGGYFDEPDFNQKELDMAVLYEKRGTLTSADGGMTIFAGSCVGGGTTLNWAGTIRTPDYVLEEWAQTASAPHFLSNDYAKSLDEAAKAIHTNTELVQNNAQNQRLWEGASKLSHKVRPIPQNIKATAEVDQKVFGYSCFGDQYGHKQSMLVTHLKMAQEYGARFMANMEARKVLVENGKAVGAVALQKHADGTISEIRIVADKVVVAAGSIHTPAILKRSGLEHPEIGKNLFLHPVVNVSGIYKEEINSWWGGMMTVTNDEFAQLDGNYGFKIETPPAHLGLISMAMPWHSGKQHKELMLQAKHVCTFIILTRDKFGGRVTLDKEGNPVAHYRPSAFDLNHLLKGVKEGVKIQKAAEAQKVMGPHYEMPFMENVPDSKLDDELRKFKWTSHRYNLFSAHQMGTCRMGGDKKSSPLAPDGQTYEVKNLYVADTSAFPNASGANPMLSVEGLAHYIAQGLK